MTIPPASSPASIPQKPDGILLHLQALLEILIVALFVTTFILQPGRVPSASMQPTLLVGDCYLIDNQAFAPSGALHKLLPPSTPRHGDLVVFRYPLDPAILLVKRIVALPGDRLRLQDNQVFLNGSSLAEPYAVYSAANPNTFRDNFPSLRFPDPSADPTWWAQLRRAITNNEIIVPPDTVFVLGDNRNDSIDSRYWGFVPQAAIAGRPLLVYLPTPPASATFLARIVATLHHVRILR